ncbi:MAG TPA: hypothetical protein VM577_06225 [Anaerovoracaceae bacterium]|nr:hypothetical protein [Anaerovoracaceae bacterium]
MRKYSLLISSLARSIRSGVDQKKLTAEYELTDKEQQELDSLLKEQDAGLRTHL